MKKITYSCDLCRETKDERCFIGIGNKVDERMYFDDISKTDKHICVTCINNISTYMDAEFIIIEGRWTFKKDTANE